GLVARRTNKNIGGSARLERFLMTECVPQLNVWHLRGLLRESLVKRAIQNSPGHLENCARAGCGSELGDCLKVEILAFPRLVRPKKQKANVCRIAWFFGRNPYSRDSVRHYFDGPIGQRRIE